MYFFLCSRHTANWEFRRYRLHISGDSLPLFYADEFLLDAGGGYVRVSRLYSLCVKRCHRICAPFTHLRPIQICRDERRSFLMHSLIRAIIVTRSPTDTCAHLIRRTVSVHAGRADVLHGQFKYQNLFIHRMG